MFMSLRRCERRSPPSSGCARRRASSCCGRSRASRSRSWRRSRHGCASARSRPSRCSSRSRATRARCACPPLTPWHHHDWWWRIRWRARHQLSHLRAPAPPSAFCRSAAPLPPLRRERMPLPPCPCPLCHLVEPLLRSARPVRASRSSWSCRASCSSSARASARAAPCNRMVKLHGRPGEPSRPGAVAVASGPAKVSPRLTSSPPPGALASSPHALLGDLAASEAVASDQA